MTPFDRGRKLIGEVYRRAREKWGYLFVVAMRVKVIPRPGESAAHFDVEFHFPRLEGEDVKLLVKDSVIRDDRFSVEEMAGIVIEDAENGGAG